MQAPTDSLAPSHSPRQAILIACAHGTRNAAGRAVIDAVVQDLRALRPDVPVRLAFADVEVAQPGVAQVVQEEAVMDGAQLACVVVPVLLSAGYHVVEDIGSAVAGVGDRACAATPLGPDDSLVELLTLRLREAGADPAASVVLAAVGSKRSKAQADVAQMAARLSTARGGTPVRAAFLAGSPGPAEVVEQLRQERPEHPVVIASYLLAPSDLGTRLLQAGADAVSATLAPHPLLTRLIWQRYDQAVATLVTRFSGPRLETN